MHLSVYMAERKLRDEDVALAVGVARATVSRWRRGLIRPDWPAIEALRVWSRNKITAEDWRFLEAGIDTPATMSIRTEVAKEIDGHFRDLDEAKRVSDGEAAE